MKGSNVHVVGCMGKMNLPMFMRILNEFQINYTVIHDADSPKNKRGKTNGVWTMNERIADTLAHGCRRIVHVPHFEGYYFRETLSSDKPYFALKALEANDTNEYPKLPELRQLITCMVAGGHPCEVTDQATLVSRVKAYVAAENLSSKTEWQF